MKTPVEYLVDNFADFGKSRFGGIKFTDYEELNSNITNKESIELMILLNFSIICVSILIVAYLVYSVIAINKIFISNTENSNKYKTIAYISMLITGGGIGWFFILLWLFGINY